MHLQLHSCNVIILDCLYTSLQSRGFIDEFPMNCKRVRWGTVLSGFVDEELDKVFKFISHIENHL